MHEDMSLRDQIVGRLTRTEGKELDISCNLTSNKQIELFIEEMALTHLGSKYVSKRADLLKRLTCSYQGKLRNDLVEIGKTPEFTRGGTDHADF